jgi:hypothetical protein
MGMSEIISLYQEEHLGDIIRNKKHTLNVYLLLMFHIYIYIYIYIYQMIQLMHLFVIKH